MVEAIRADLGAPLRIAELAREAGVHPVYLARAFRRHLRSGPAEYIRGARIDAAKQSLADSDLPLSQVARAAGFADQSHFTRQFRRVVGASPGRYRRDLRG